MKIRKKLVERFSKETPTHLIDLIAGIDPTPPDPYQNAIFYVRMESIDKETDKKHNSRAFNKEFFTLKNPRTKHVRMPRFLDRVNNNLVERLNGTVRERDKVMRGFKTEESAQQIIEGFRAYYNFIRKHQSLKGKTPAEVANIDLNLDGNKWLMLIRKAKGKS